MTAERPVKATPDTWMYPPPQGWTYEQVKDLELPFEWELVDGAIVVRGMRPLWHNLVRDELYHRLRSAKREPYAVASEQCVLVDENNPRSRISSSTTSATWTFSAWNASPSRRSPW